MAISIPSDLVLDVARAADPSRVAKASADLNAGVPVADLGLGRSAGAGSVSRPFSSYLPNFSSTAQATVRQPISPEKKAATEMETLLLQQMLESVLPKEESAVFGQGTAGSVWRSMLAEQVARQLASSGEVHLSNMLTRKPG